MITKLPRLLGCILIVLISFQIGTTQKLEFHNHTVSKFEEPKEIDEILSDYDIITKDFDEDVSHLKSHESLDLQLSYKDKEYDLFLHRNYLLDDNYISRTTEGKSNQNIAITTDGYTRSGQRASITIARDFIYGYFEDDKGEKIRIEPLHFFREDAKPNEFIVFYEKHVLDTAGGVCGTNHEHHMRERMHQQMQNSGSESQMPMATCLEVELAIASDYLMFQSYGTVSAVENRNIGVINDVQTDYVNEFNDDLEFSIVEQFTVNCSGCDPWTSSTDAGSLLSDFTGWGPTGFSSNHDMGELWTDRDFNGGTIGIAWVGAVCFTNRYHALQDFSSNADLTRVLVSHEMGHNFDATHDASGSNTIMAPAVNNTTQWSTQSKNEINGFVNGIDPPTGCLTVCTNNTVSADFGFVESSLCEGASVQFFDKSTGPVTSYNWNFPGGSPATSTSPNPTVTYPASGSYSVTLTVSSAGGSDSKTMSNAINVGVGGNAIKAFEDFEDGSTGSWTASGGQSWEISQENGVLYGNNTFKVNNFSSSGMVDLESPVIDLLGHDQATLNINYSYATRNGNSDSLIVYVSTDGGNSFEKVAGYAENGTGNFATAPNISGSFSPVDSSEWCHGPNNNNCLAVPLSGAEQSQNVVVKVSNKSFGGNNLHIDFLYVTTDCYELFPPISDFTANVQQGCEDLTVEFQDISQENPVNWNWSFPGGTPSSSTDPNPTVYYPSPGSYSVQLTTSNPAGSDTESKVDFIYVEGLPDAFFTHTIDSGRTVSFNNQSNEAINYSWNFDDGNSSIEENPTHTYSQDGSYNVKLTSSNDCGADEFTTIVDIATPPVAGFNVSDTVGCEKTDIIFDATSSSNTTAYYWEFEGGSPSTSTQMVPSVTYDSAGVFDVLFVASNANGNDTIALTDHIQIDPLPESEFIFSKANLTVEFFNNSTDYDSLHWDFDDGNTTSDENPTHTYNSEGTYDVSLVTFNSCGNDTLTQAVQVDEALTAMFTSDITSGCVSFDVQFNGDGSTGANSFAWTFEGGSPSTSTDPNPTITYPDVGTYDVTLIVSDGPDTDTLEFPDYIIAEGGPNGDFQYTTVEREVAFSLNANNFDELLWDFGDGNTSTDNNPTHEYGADGTYNVLLTLINECDTIEVSEEVEIATPPISDFSIDVTEGCLPLEVSFMNNSSENAATFAWTFEGGNPGTSTMKNPTVTYSMAGTFDIELIAISSGGRDTMTMENAITVFPDPNADYNFEVDTTTVDFTNLSTEADTFFWDFGDGNTSTEENPTHTYVTEGSYTVTLMAINDCDTSIFTREIGTASLPSADFSVAGNTDGCVPFTVEYKNQSTGTVDNYEWTFEGGTPATSNEQNPTVVYNSTGTFNVTLKVTNSAGDNEIVRNDYITVNEIAEGNIEHTILDTLSVNFDGSVTGDPSATVEWNFGDGNSSNQEDVVYTYSEPGTYNVLFIVNNECGSDTSTVEIMLDATSVVQEQLAKIRVYPNPASGMFTVDRLPNGALLKISDQLGQTVYDRRARSTRLDINSLNWSPGVYYLKVYHQDEYHVYRVVIQD